MVGGADNPGALKRLTHNIPVVFYGTPDPVRSGLVESFSRPGGNLTGTSTRAYELAAKRLEILLEVSPRSKRVAALRIASPTNEFFFAELLEAAKKTSATVVDIPILKDVSLKTLVTAIQKARADAVILTFGMSEEGRGLFEWLANHGVPSISPWIADAKAGGLMSLGEPLAERIARAVGIAVRVLRGEKPATIAVDQLSRFHLAINVRTARKLRLRIPESIRVRADEVIE